MEVPETNYVTCCLLYFRRNGVRKEFYSHNARCVLCGPVREENRSFFRYADYTQKIKEACLSQSTVQRNVDFSSASPKMKISESNGSSSVRERERVSSSLFHGCVRNISPGVIYCSITLKMEAM